MGALRLRSRGGGGALRLAALPILPACGGAAVGALRPCPAFSITWISRLSSPIFALPVTCTLVPCGAFPFAVKGLKWGLAFVVRVGGGEAI